MDRPHESPALALIVGTIGLLTAAASGLAQVVEVPNVRQQFDELGLRPDPMGFFVSSFSPGYSFTGNPENHWQGIARHPDPSVPIVYMIGSRDGCTKLSIVRIGSADIRAGSRMRSNRLSASAPSYNTPPLAADRIIGEVEIPDYHGGAMQAAGNYLAIPSGRSCMGQSGRVLFYDISNPLAPVYNSDVRPNSSPGIVGFTQDDFGRYCLAIAGGDNYHVDFLRTSGGALEDWSRIEDWSPSNLDKSIVNVAWPHCDDPFGSPYCHQSLQLVNPTGEPDNVLYMLGFQQVAAAAPLVTNANLIWLFKVTLEQGNVTVQTQAIRELKTATVDGSGFDNGNFSAAAGLYVSPAGEMIAYTTEHYINFNNAAALNDVVVMSEFASRRGIAPPSSPVAPCVAHVELATDTDFGGRILKVDALDYRYENYAMLGSIDGGFANNISSVTWTLPAGCTCRLYAGANYAGNYLDLVGSGELATLAGVAWSNGGAGSPNNSIQSIGFLGSSPSPIVPADASMPLSFIAASVVAGPCAMVKFQPGDYPFIATATTFGRQCELRNIGPGLVRLGTTP
ncbi:MAG TPA: hypothetical protein PKE29_09705 [Phycisphaerales bacterium]|nr:hypothetical protein [Phycisphaerales bacterium]